MKLKKYKMYHGSGGNIFTLPNSVQVNLNSISIGSKVYEKLGEPERISFYYDLDERIIGLKAEDDGYKVSKKNRSGNIQLKAFLRRMGVKEKELCISFYDEDFDGVLIRLTKSKQEEKETEG